MSNNVDIWSGLQRLPCWTHLYSAGTRQSKLDAGTGSIMSVD